LNELTLWATKEGDADTEDGVRKQQDWKSPKGNTRASIRRRRTSKKERRNVWNGYAKVMRRISERGGEG
jgi:hypothetical protein